MAGKMIGGIEDRVLVQRLKAVEDAIKQQAKVRVEYPSVQVKLIRGQRGNYGWEIKCTGDNIAEVLAEIEAMDLRLKKMYGGNGNG